MLQQKQQQASKANDSLELLPGHKFPTQTRKQTRW